MATQYPRHDDDGARGSSIDEYPRHDDDGARGASTDASALSPNERIKEHLDRMRGMYDAALVKKFGPKEVLPSLVVGTQGAHVVRPTMVIVPSSLFSLLVVAPTTERLASSKPHPHKKRPVLVSP